MDSTLDLLKNIYLPFNLDEEEGIGKGGDDSCLIENNRLEKEKIETTLNNESIDRLSELPDQVLHQILSLLDMKQVVQTMFLSKRWKDVWRFVSNLSFDHTNWIYTYSSKNSKWQIVPHKIGFINFVNGVLSQLERLKIESFCLSGGGCFCDDELVDEWISTVIGCDVEEIYLNLDTALPRSLLNLENKVRKLDLVSVQLQGDVFNEEIVLSLPNLETLNIKGCNHSNIRLLSICCPQLQNLVLDNDILCEVSACVIRICTPNLNTLNCKGSMYKYYIWENISACVTANFAFYLRVNALRLLEVLHGLANVETLELSHCWFEDNIKQSSFMKKCGANVPFQFNFRFLNIKDLEGSDSELKFLEILFENASLLESLTIRTTTSSSVEGKILRKFEEKLYSLPKACASLNIQYTS